MPNGGARKGSGRKPKREKYLTAIAKAEKRCADHLPVLIDNMERLADGVIVQEEDCNGRQRIYSRPPDRQANEYLINRVAGKPVEQLQHDYEARITLVMDD